MTKPDVDGTGAVGAGTDEAWDMVGMPMRDDDGGEVLRRQAVVGAQYRGGRSLGDQPRAEEPSIETQRQRARTRRDARAVAGIDQHELGPGIDDDRIERRNDAALRHFSGNRIDSFTLARRAHHRVVRVAVSLIECTPAVSRFF